MKNKKSKKPELERRVRRLLKAIEIGKVTLVSKSERSPQHVYAGNVHYESSNGWKLVVFNDCGEWDYLDSAVSPQGERLSYSQMSHALFLEYKPPIKVWWERYGIPGYLKFRKIEWKGFQSKEAK